MSKGGKIKYYSASLSETADFIFSYSIAQWPAYLHPPIKNIKYIIFITTTVLRIINAAGALLQISELGCIFELCLN